MNLARDLLDKQLVDRNGRKAGKVDGIVLKIQEGRPRIAYLEVGWPVLARRLGKRPARWSDGLLRHWNGGIRTRLPWERIESVGRDIHLDIDSEKSTLLTVERWLRRQIVRRMPGGNHGKK